MNKVAMGVGWADISPPLGIVGRLGLDHTMDLPGHPCRAKALFVDGDEPILQITCELVGLTGSVKALIHGRIEAEMGLPRDRVVLTGTHTHSSPWLWDRQDREAARYGFKLLDRGYLNRLIEGCVEAARAARGNVGSSRLRLGVARVVDVASNRVQFGWRSSICSDDGLRAMPVGDIDPDVRVLGVCDAGGAPRALIANYACHPSGYGGGRTLFSSPDFPYHAERFISDAFGRYTPLFYWMGCAGDINPGKFVSEGSHTEVEALGRRLADGILAAWRTASEIDGEAALRFADFAFPLGEWIEPLDDARRRFAQVSERVRHIQKSGEPIDGSTIRQWRMAIKRLDVCLVARDGKMPVRMHLLHIGNLKLLFVPGEWFHRIGLELAQCAPPGGVWTTTLANFDVLYVPDRQSMPHRDWYGVAPNMRTISDSGVEEMIEAAFRFLGES